MNTTYDMIVHLSGLANEGECTDLLLTLSERATITKAKFEEVVTFERIGGAQ